MSSKAARRYANAFLLTALETEQLETCRQDILFIKETIEDSRELQLFLKSPIVKKEKKFAVLKELFEKNVGDLTFRLIEVLSSKDREQLLEGITNMFIKLYNRHEGIIEVGVSGAMKMDETQLQDLKKELQESTGKSVNIHQVVDEELIGGIKVRIEDTVIDGTVKYKLSQLKDRLTSAAID